jgi:hypothetical protein
MNWHPWKKKENYVEYEYRIKDECESWHSFFAHKYDSFEDNIESISEEAAEQYADNSGGEAYDGWDESSGKEFEIRKLGSEEIKTVNVYLSWSPDFSGYEKE